MLTIGGNTVLDKYIILNGVNPCTVVVESGSSFQPESAIDTSAYAITDNGSGTWTVTAK